MTTFYDLLCDSLALCAVLMFTGSFLVALAVFGG